MAAGRGILLSYESNGHSRQWAYSVRLYIGDKPALFIVDNFKDQVTIDIIILEAVPRYISVNKTGLKRRFAMKMIAIPA